MAFLKRGYYLKLPLQGVFYGPESPWEVCVRSRLDIIADRVVNGSQVTIEDFLIMSVFGI